ncbi:family 16 glycosylhydrolase [uncultured Flavobacterium sp.]|uniref:family 16 glycosylhydrolase n=1 Tax=uncultured Flavobacterium sp. TaxID=165435 RepID=UPI0026292288|nr:family 16 glycosylhydrolase [uncultured Flavobacterium sp.]
MKNTFKIVVLIAFLFNINLATAQVDVIYNDLVWSDEFESNGAVNATKWHHQTQLPAGGNWFNGEEQHYTNELTNSFVENGVLKIVAKKEAYTTQGYTKQYTSARLNSKFAFTYGRVDIRAKIPTNQGTWPALWMLGKNVIEPGAYFSSTYGTASWPACGEIDIMEHGITSWQPAGYVQSALHTSSSFGNTTNIGGTIANNLGSDFHVYSMNWSPNQITFLLDGVPFYTYNPAVKNASNWPFNLDQYLLLNIAMGGVAGTIPSNFIDATMEVDYVRVYQNTQLDTQIPLNFTAAVGTVTSSSVELLLNATDNSGTVNYNIVYGSNSISAYGNSGVQKSVIIPNLTADTNYSFSISASDASGNNATNNAIVLNARTLGFVGCSGSSSVASQGTFSIGYNYSFETIGNSVKITFELQDTDKIGLVAYLWRQSPFAETPMTNVSNRIFTQTITNQTLGTTIYYAVKFAYANGMSVTQYIPYVVGNNCSLNQQEFDDFSNFTFTNPSHDFISIASETTIDKVEIFNLIGNKVVTQAENTNQIDVSSLSKGMYLLIVYSEHKKGIKKIIIN